jgi:endonuclease/exonuclease/phosphatase family metal-dependent hydrolase
MLKIVTYNILFSRHTEEITQNITLMAEKGIHIFCLQEVLKNADKPFIIDLLLNKLGKHWKATYHLGNEGTILDFGTAILWNTKILEVKTTQKVLLPKRNHVSPHEWIFAKLMGNKGKPIQRRAIISSFLYKNKKIIITAVHLDATGGTKNRLKQLHFLIDTLRNKYNSKQQIICGDFNNFDLLKTGNEQVLLQNAFGNEWKDASKSIPWSADLNKVDKPKKFPIFVLLIRFFHIHIQRRLDYIWIKGFKLKKVESLHLSGSDHLPIIATLE